MNSPPPIYIQPEHNQRVICDKRIRNSNLELYRIIVMIFIVAHHYVVNSGLFDVLKENAGTISSSAMLLFGAWGKTGINCFLLITGYFMCRSRISWQKLLKLYFQITFYSVVIYGIFCYTGHEPFTPIRALMHFIPIKSLTPSDFVSCFLIFYLFIPFVNVLIANINRKQHLFLIGIIFFTYTLLPLQPHFIVSLDYIAWFICIYIIGAYLRMYENEMNITHRMWGFISVNFIVLGSISILVLSQIHFFPYLLVSDSNSILAVLISISTFMWFKDLKIKYSPIINSIGGATFGVLLIHANSDAMRQWLWKDVVDCVGHLKEDVFYTMGYAILSVIMIFIVSAIIDIFRRKYLEPYIIGKIEKFNIRNNFILKGIE